MIYSENFISFFTIILAFFNYYITILKKKRFSQKMKRTLYLGWDYICMSSEKIGFLVQEYYRKCNCYIFLYIDKLKIFKKFFKK